MTLLNIIGDKYGRLTVSEEVEPYLNPSKTYRSRKFKCECECGNTVEVNMSSLRNGNTKSCGCYASDLVVKSNKNRSKYGKYSENRHFSRWKGMIERCYYKKNKEYHNYGGRGITVCKQWKDHPKEFIEWIENKSNYKEGLTLNRIDNDKGYSPKNCTFSTLVEQARNTRLQKNNISGKKGVSLHGKNRWRARINVDKKRITLGVFDNVEDAIKAREQAEEKYYK